jgi:hypothetical protein
MLSTSAAAAQARDPHAGVEIVGAATYVTVPKGTSRRIGPGGAAGLFAVVPLIGTYKLQPEMLYEYRESKVLGVRRRYEYVTGALLLRVSLFKGLYITEGPTYRLPRRVRVGSADVTSNTKRDISIVIGVGKRGRHVALEGRWDSSIPNIQKSLVADDVPTRHRSLGVVLAIF